MVWDNQWLAWQLKEGWDTSGQNIGWVEMVADLAVKSMVCAGLSHCHIIIRSDNAGVVGALAADKSWSSQQNLILQHIISLFQSHNIGVTVKWVPTTHNLADGPSQGIFPPHNQIFAFLLSIPLYLSAFVHKAIKYSDL